MNSNKEVKVSANPLPKPLSPPSNPNNHYLLKQQQQPQKQQLNGNTTRPHANSHPITKSSHNRNHTIIHRPNTVNGYPQHIYKNKSSSNHSHKSTNGHSIDRISLSPLQIQVEKKEDEQQRKQKDE